MVLRSKKGGYCPLLCTSDSYHSAGKLGIKLGEKRDLKYDQSHRSEQSGLIDIKVLIINYIPYVTIVS